MRLMVWKTDEGPTDGEFKTGDIFSVHADDWVPGNEETIKWVVVEMDNFGGDWASLTESDYTTGQDGPVLRHMRKYYLDFSSLTETQADRWLNPKTRAPIVKNVWNLQDIKRR